MTSKLAHSTCSFWGCRAGKKKTTQACAAAIGNKGNFFILEELFGNVLLNLSSLILLCKGVSNSPGPYELIAFLVQKKGRRCSCGLSWAIRAVLSDLHGISMVKEQRAKDLKRIFSGKRPAARIKHCPWHHWEATCCEDIQVAAEKSDWPPNMSDWSSNCLSHPFWKREPLPKWLLRALSATV